VATDTHHGVLKVGTDWSAALLQSVFGLAIRCADPHHSEFIFFRIWWWAGSESNTRHKDFQPNYRGVTEG
jgi:hypothetical protein